MLNRNTKSQVKINKEFELLLHKPGVKFTIILGSGFHRQAIGGESILSSWEKLLKEKDEGLNLTGFITLDYERLISRRINNNQDSKIIDQAASKLEKQISDEISQELKDAQENALKNCTSCYPIGIFNPNKVSDIVSLNFDTAAEKLCCELANIKKAKKLFVEFESSSKKNLKISYYSVGFKDQESIRFWYPHGSIHNKTKNILGIREYSMRLSIVERLRKHSKSKNELLSWYKQLTHNPVLILGADMSISEWDIWFALVNRARNFVKSDNQKNEYPIFQMRECECNRDYRHEWFQPLFTGMKYDQQWKKLEELFKTK